MSELDLEIIRDHADRLYVLAALIVWLTALLGAAIGCGAGFLLGKAVALELAVSAMLGCGVGLVGGLAGWTLGTNRAFSLRLQAQVTLCLAQIEENTRLPQADFLSG